MAIENGQQVSAGTIPVPEKSNIDLTELEDEDLDDVDLTEYDVERVERVIEYETQIQFAETERPPDPSSISFRDAVWEALEEKNLTPRNVTGRIQKVDVKDGFLHLLYIVDGQTCTTEVMLDSEQYARLLDYCGVPASAVQNLTGKQIPVQKADSDEEENYSLLLSQNNSSIANSVYSMYRTLYKYRVVDVVSDDDNGAQSFGIPIHNKVLLTYIFGLLLTALSVPFAPFGFELFDMVFFILVLMDVILSMFWGMMALVGITKITAEIKRNYLPV